MIYLYDYSSYRHAFFLIILYCDMHMARPGRFLVSYVSLDLEYIFHDRLKIRRLEIEILVMMYVIYLNARSSCVREIRMGLQDCFLRVYLIEMIEWWMKYCT